MTISGRITAALVLVAGGLALLTGCGGEGEQAPEAPATETAGPEAQAPSPPPAQPEAAGSGQPETATAEQAGTTAGADPEAIMQKAGCLACHEVDKKKIGPAYTWVAHRYQDDPDAAATLAKSVKNGSSGKWKDVTGGVPMPPNPQLSGDDLDTVIQWVLDREPAPPPS